MSITPLGEGVGELAQGRGADVVTFLFSAVAVVALGLESGGFYPRAWQWGSLVAVVTLVAVVVWERRVALSGEQWRMLAALAAFAAWVGVTVVSDRAATVGVPELERASLYLAVLLAAMALPRRRSPHALPAGVLAGAVIVCVVGLVEYLSPSINQSPDTFEGRHLFQPIGYANAFGILVGMGALLALGLAGGAARRIDRALAAGALVPLLTALALTSSRGAALAVGIGLATALGIDRHGLHLLATLAKVVPLPIVAIAVALHSRVSNSQVSMNLVARDGRIVGATLAVLTVAACAGGYFALAGERRQNQPQPIVLAAGLMVAAGTTVLALSHLDAALGDRPKYWHVALLDLLHHPLIGSGAGSFGAAWLRYRTIDTPVQDAHNLYLETLAELGPIGLALLVIALATPLRRVTKASPTSVIATVCGAYVAFLAHSAIDWDWEMPVVTVAALLCGVALLHSQQTTIAVTTIHKYKVAAVAFGAAACAALFALNAAALAGNDALHQAVTSLQSNSWAQAANSARTASRWQPWSAEPYDLLGQAELASGHRNAAAQSFRHALRLDDDRWQTWYELARIGTPKERQAALEHILILNPLAVRTNGR
jgi:hypothetical protein